MQTEDQEEREQRKEREEVFAKANEELEEDLSVGEPVNEKIAKCVQKRFANRMPDAKLKRKTRQLQTASELPSTTGA